MAKQVTETPLIYQIPDPEPILEQITKNIVAFKDTKTAEEMRRNVNEHRSLNDQLEEILNHYEEAA